MKKRDSYSHIDRNHTAINGNYPRQQRANIVSPEEYLLGQIWIQEEETNGVKIIELDSNSSNNDNDEDKQHLSHAWSYVNKDRFQIPQSPDGECTVNHRAREKHRQEHALHNQEVSSAEIEESCIRNFLYSNIQAPDNDVANGEFRPHSNNGNCSTNANNYPKTSDSSTDVEYFDRNDIKAEQMSWDAEDRYYDEILTYDSKIDAEKRTIYIYSFKNKHLFTENDGLNISNGTSSTSTDIGDETIKDKSNGRIPSPIPELYVPKLNLIQAPKLPTVTEITEPKNSEENINFKFDAKMPRNCWFTDTSYHQHYSKPSSVNLINSMSLSPREKRHRSRSTFCENCRYQARLQMVREASPIGEDVLSARNNVESLAVVGDILQTPVRYFGMSQETDFQSANDICEELNRVEDRGDHAHNKPILKPKIRVSPKASADIVKISEPIEKLDGNWIGDETIVLKRKFSTQQVQTEDNDNVFSGAGEVSKRLWDNSLVLLKPTEWSSYFPVDNSVPSLNLSLETEIEEVTWFRRMIRCLKCFQ